MTSSGKKRFVRFSALIVLLPLVVGNLVTESATAEIVIRSVQSSGSERFLSVKGDFGSTDPTAKFLLAVSEGRPEFVTFDSNGGNIYSAMKLGRLIRKYGLNTFQLKSFECSSACALAFVGGVQRVAEPGSIGVHKTSFSNLDGVGKDQAVSAIQEATADVIEYLTEMDIDLALLLLSLRYESWDIRYLSGSEMVQYRVMNLSDIAVSPNRQTQLHPRVPEFSPGATKRSTIPTAKTGAVRHPRGYVEMRLNPDAEAPGILWLPNRARVTILDNAKTWYRVRYGNRIGYMHHTWVMVDQFLGGEFDRKFIQIKSFRRRQEAEAYIRSSPLSVSAFLSTNGWLAVALDGQFSDSEASHRLRQLKTVGTIPDDSFRTYGNSYVKKLCCGPP